MVLDKYLLHCAACRGSVGFPPPAGDGGQSQKGAPNPCWAPPPSKCPSPALCSSWFHILGFGWRRPAVTPDAWGCPGQATVASGHTGHVLGRGSWGCRARGVQGTRGSVHSQDLGGCWPLQLVAGAGRGHRAEPSPGLDLARPRAPGRAARGDLPSRPGCLPARCLGSSRPGFAACHVLPCCLRRVQRPRAEVSEATGLSRQQEK